MELVSPLVDHTCYFRHAPVRLRVAANMYGCACGYVAVSCCNAALVTRKFQHKRAAAPAEWHQLLSA